MDIKEFKAGIYVITAISGHVFIKQKTPVNTY
jgi:hypothetical protein